MKHLLLTTIAAVLLVGCGEAQQSAPQAEPVESVAEVPAQPSSPPAEAKPVEPVPEAAQPLRDAKAPNTQANRALSNAVFDGNIESVKQHLAAGTDVNAKDDNGWTHLHHAAIGFQGVFFEDRKEIVKLLIAKGADVNAKDRIGKTPLDLAISNDHTETANLLRKHGGKTREELKAEGK